MKKHLLLFYTSLIVPLNFKNSAATALKRKKRKPENPFIRSGTKFAYFNRQVFFNFVHFGSFLLLLTCNNVMAWPTRAAVHMLTPTIAESGSPGALTTTYGSASASTSFSVSGSNMLQGVLVTPPSGFEVSLNNSTFAPTVTIGSSGNIPPTTLYIRLAAVAGAGSYSGNIALTSTGATTVNVLMPVSTVNPASLIISPNSVTKTYGTALTTVTGSTAFTDTGLQNGETIGSVTISYTAGSAATDGVGTYSYVVSASSPTGGTFDPANYSINYTYGQIIVNPAPLSITANDVIKTYGQTLTGGPGSTAFTAVGLQNGETIGSVTIGYGTGAQASYPAEPCDECVTAANATGGTFGPNNYTITYIPGIINVVPAALTITANNVTKTYGETLTGGSGSTAFTATGLQNGETVGSVTIDYGTGAQASYPVGSCDECVTAANATGGTFSLNNYIITYIPGNIIVVPAALTITADNLVKLYGEPNPALTITYSGFVNNEGPAQLTTLPTVTTTATIFSPPGEYPITAADASDPNYVITYVPGLLTITNAFNIPNAFTPNGDGINDNWHIQFLENYQNCTVNIFNRNGQSVYYSTGYGVPWDGTYKGSALPTGTYYYVIQLKDINKVLSGYVALIR